jgi:hypothetical protein
MTTEEEIEETHWWQGIADLADLLEGKRTDDFNAYLRDFLDNVRGPKPGDDSLEDFKRRAVLDIMRGLGDGPDTSPPFESLPCEQENGLAFNEPRPKV